MTGSLLLFLLAVGPIAAAIVSYIIGRYSKNARNLFADGVAIAEFCCIFVLLIRRLAGGSDLSFCWAGFCGMGLNLMLDGFRALYGSVAALMWMMTTIFSREYFGHYRNRNRYYMFMLMTLGATMGVFLSADLYTTFIFFEIMSFTSYVWVVHEEKEAAMRAGATYLAVAVIGGLVMLMGLFMLYDMTGTLVLSELLAAVKALPAVYSARLYVAGGLMAFGFGAKAGMFPLHIWLPKAHPVAPAPASALLSGILTKSGIFGILAVTSNIFLYDPYWGLVILLLGVLTMFGGALLAVFSVDLKRTLACSSMSQIGFILVGVGMQCLLGEENALAVRGTLLHMVNHSLFKLDLFMVAGVVFMNLHRLNLNEIRGFGRKKPLLCFCYLMGALGIGGIPGWNGYISKTLLHESIVEYTELLEENPSLIGTAAGFKAIEWIFLISGGMTVAYMLKLFVAVFLEENSDRKLQKQFDAKKDYWNLESKIAVVGSAVILPVLGQFPYVLMNGIADLGQGFMHGTAPEHAVNYFSLTNLKGGLISIAIGAVIYLLLIRTLLMKKTADGKKEYVDDWPAWLDIENLIYRPILLKVVPGITGFFCEILDRVLDCVPVLITVGTVLGRACDKLADSIIVLLRSTTHRAAASRYNEPREHRIGVFVGRLRNITGNLLDRTVRRKQPLRKNYIHSSVEWEEGVARTGKIIGGSMSFALIMAGMGIILLLVYMALVH